LVSGITNQIPNNSNNSNPLRNKDIKMKTLKTLFKQKPAAHLVYDSQSFQMKFDAVVLENDLEIQLPKQLIGKNIKQVELVPKSKQFEVVFTYEPDETVLNQIKEAKDKMMSIDLGLNELANRATNGMMWFLLMNKVATRRFLFV
jgi:transposase